MIIRKILAAAGIFVSTTIAASGATLTGDQVNVNLMGGVDFGGQTALVGVGSDASFFGNQFIDLNAGANGDVLTITSSNNFGGGIQGSYDGPITYTFTDLDFSGGETLVGFTFTQTFSNVVAAITANSLTLTFDDAPLPAGTYLQGQFVTSGTQTPPVPLPASVLLLLGGLVGLGAMKRRKG